MNTLLNKLHAFAFMASDSYDIRCKEQYEVLAAISLIEKCRYLAASAQQLKYDILIHLSPILEHNLETLRKIDISRCYSSNYFEMNLYFSWKVCILTHEKILKAIKKSYDDKSLHENISTENEQCTLEQLCQTLDTIWNDYWQVFHIDNRCHEEFLNSIEENLIRIYSAICIKGNESFPENYSCKSCCKNSAYLNTGISNECDGSESKGCGTNYCYHFIDVRNKFNYPNINRIIFESRLNEVGAKSIL